MPTLFRFLSLLIFVAVIIFAAVWALATFVEPRRSEIVVPIPADRLKLPPAPSGAGEGSDQPLLEPTNP